MVGIGLLASSVNDLFEGHRLFLRLASSSSIRNSSRDLTLERILLADHRPKSCLKSTRVPSFDRMTAKRPPFFPKLSWPCTVADAMYDPRNWITWEAIFQKVGHYNSCHATRHGYTTTNLYSLYSMVRELKGSHNARPCKV